MSTVLPKIVCRLATAADRALVARLDATDDKTSFPMQAGGSFIDGIIAMGGAYLAFVDGNTAGYARVDTMWPERVPLLSWMWTEPAHRGQGVAATLLSFVEHTLVGLGYQAMLVSACDKRPQMVLALAEQYEHAGSLKFLDGTVESFFWARLG